MATLLDRLTHVRSKIAQACTRVNQPIDSVTLIAVSKTHPPEMVLEAVACGQTHFGENRIEEATTKIEAIKAATTAPLTWHMIGHVQSRKAKDVIAHCDTIHSLDNLKLAERYSRFAVELKRSVSVLLEISISGEANKSGFTAYNWQQDRAVRAALWADVQQIVVLPGLRLDGLMTMAPIADDPEQVRPVFSGLRHLRDALTADLNGLRLPTLSMGMTDDYEVAIEEGATMVRIGRAIFGTRETA